MFAKFWHNLISQFALSGYLYNDYFFTITKKDVKLLFTTVTQSNDNE